MMIKKNNGESRRVFFLFMSKEDREQKSGMKSEDKGGI